MANVTRMRNITKFDGYICDKDNKIIGEYSYSFIACRFSFQVGNEIHHWVQKEELEQYLIDHDYHILGDES